MRGLAVASLVLTLTSSAALLDATPAPPSTRRLAVIVGANRGAAGRVPLRYAVADAERFASVVTGMGGVRAEDVIVLRDPTRRVLLDALSTTRARAGGALEQPSRLELLVYFSGHADDQGLMLGRESLSYRELRAAIGEVAADVGVTILDACASGAITRLKGGQPYAAFLTDTSSQVQGYAFLTSSSENEAAQESERLQGSFFTNALLTGLRGAADVSGDGRITLGEAYQFAFSETLAQTTTTEAGAQHPAYDIKMAGTGDVVLTDVRQISSSLILGDEYAGRFFVLNRQHRLVAELYKPSGRKVELGLEPGVYDVYFEQEKQLLASNITLVEGQRHELSREGLRAARRRPTQRRGDAPALTDADLFDGRTRVETSVGFRTGQDGGPFKLTFLHWVKPEVSLEFSLGGIDGSHFGGYLLGARYYPPRSGSVRPFLSGAAGFFNGSAPIIDDLGPGKEGRLSVGAGVDLFSGRLTSSLAGYLTCIGDRWMPRFDLALTTGWTFGRGRPRVEGPPKRTKVTP